MEALDNRLELIYHMTRQGRPAADIGSDHGRLIAALVRTGRVPRGVATDIRPKPLEKTQALISRLGLGERVEVLLCDGLEAVAGDMADDIIIAGMGGELIARIMDRWPHSTQADKRFLLQPMTRPEALRDYLYQNGFAIEEERCAEQGGYVYSVMAARYNGEKKTPSQRERYLGAIEGFGHGPARTYAQRLLHRLERRVLGMERAGEDAGSLRQVTSLLQELLKEVSV